MALAPLLEMGKEYLGNSRLYEELLKFSENIHESINQAGALATLLEMKEKYC